MVCHHMSPACFASTTACSTEAILFVRAGQRENLLPNVVAWRNTRDNITMMYELCHRCSTQGSPPSHHPRDRRCRSWAGSPCTKRQAMTAHAHSKISVPAICLLEGCLQSQRSLTGACVLSSEFMGNISQLHLCHVSVSLWTTPLTQLSGCVDLHDIGPHHQYSSLGSGVMRATRVCVALDMCALGDIAGGGRREGLTAFGKWWWKYTSMI